MRSAGRLVLSVLVLSIPILAPALAGCGGAPAPAPGWKTCRIRGLKNASGLAVYKQELVLVAGQDDRNIYVVPRRALQAEGMATARGLIVDVKEDAYLVGAETFSEQGYQLKHLWALPLDFQAVATRVPGYVFVGDRERRVIFWGRLVWDAAGRLARARLDRLVAAPGATRTDAGSGDWRDKGPGLAGLVAPPGRRTEDLLLIDGGQAGGRFQRVRKTDMYGSVLGGILLAAAFTEAPQIQALSWYDGEIVFQKGTGAGKRYRFREPLGARTAPATGHDAGPDLPAGETWTGMAHGADGTLYLVSDGAPALVAWRPR